MIEFFLDFMNATKRTRGKSSSKSKGMTRSEQKLREKKAFIFKKHTKLAEDMEKDMPYETHQQKQMRNFYEGMAKQIDTYDLFNEKKLKYAYDKIKNEQAAYMEKTGMDGHAQNIVLDKLSTRLLIPEQEVEEEGTTPRTSV